MSGIRVAFVYRDYERHVADDAADAFSPDTTLRFADVAASRCRYAENRHSI